MRDVATWGTAVLLVAAALYTVAVRREVYEEARRIGALQERLAEARRANDNLVLVRTRLASPGWLRERAERAELLAPAEDGR